MNLYTQYLSVMQLFFSRKEEPVATYLEDDVPLKKAA